MRIDGLKLLGKVCLLGALAYGQTALANIGGRVWVDNNCNGIFDAGDVLQPGVTVQLFNCDAGVFVATQVTDQNGQFLFDNFGPPDNYKVCVTLPPGFSFAPQVVVQPPVGDCCDSSVGPDGCTACFFWNNNIDISHNAGLCLSNTPPPCACVNPALGLGAAVGGTVFELGPHQVSINGPAGGIIGNVLIAPGGHANFSGGGEYINGNIFLGVGAQYQNSGTILNGSVFYNQDLSAQIAAAYAAYGADVALPATQTYTGGNLITGVPGLNVVDVPGDLHPNGNTVSINAAAGSLFIIRVHGLLKLDGGGKILVGGGVQPSDVIYVVVGTGQDVGATGGGGGANCCNAVYDGTILAPYRKISLSPGLVNGQIISGQDISIVSGSGVHCPQCPP